MKHLICLLMLVACGSGKDGSDGAAGKDGTDNALKSVLACEGPLSSLPETGYWNGVTIAYQRAETTAGDVTVSAVMRGSHTGSTMAFYKKGMEGAEKGSVTLGVGDGVFLLLYTAGPYVLPEANGTTDRVIGRLDCKEY